DADDDDWSLGPLVARGARYRSLVLSHVLEHLDDPVPAFRRLLVAARGLGVERALVIVPGRSGFATDATHRTFVDRQMLELTGTWQGTGFEPQAAHYFPGDARRLGDAFPHHELRVL